MMLSTLSFGYCMPEHEIISTYKSMQTMFSRITMYVGFNCVMHGTSTNLSTAPCTFISILQQSHHLMKFEFLLECHTCDMNMSFLMKHGWMTICDILVWLALVAPLYIVDILKGPNNKCRIVESKRSSNKMDKNEEINQTAHFYMIRSV